MTAAAATLRRNDIAFDRRESPHIVYGRIVTISNGIATIINARDGTEQVPVEHVGTDNDYRGFTTTGRPYETDGILYNDVTFHRMPTLRRLKQIASRREGGEVWAKERRRIDRRRRRALVAMAALDRKTGQI